MKANRVITDEDVLYILKADVLSLAGDLAEEIGVSLRLVQEIRNGTRYSDVYPEAKRVPLVSRSRGCGGCKAWTPAKQHRSRGTCELMIREAEEQGSTWGYSCSFYNPIPSELTPLQSERLPIQGGGLPFV